MQEHTRTYTHSRAHTRVHAHACTHTHASTRMHAHACKHKHAGTLVGTNARWHARWHAQSHARAHARIHASACSESAVMFLSIAYERPSHREKGTLGRYCGRTSAIGTWSRCSRTTAVSDSFSLSPGVSIITRPCLSSGCGQYSSTHFTLSCSCLPDKHASPACCDANKERYALGSPVASSLGADVAGLGPVPLQMWQGRAPCR